MDVIHTITGFKHHKSFALTNSFYVTAGGYGNH